MTTMPASVLQRLYSNRWIPALIFGLLLGVSDSRAQDCEVAGNVLSCLEVRNDLDVGRGDEVGFSGVAIPRSAGVTGTELLEVADLTGVPVPAQFRTLARWGGTVDDVSLPIRWLEVAIQDPVGAEASNDYQLRRLAAPPAPPAGALAVSDLGSGRFRVDTGAAVFTIDGSNPALLEDVTVGADTVYSHSPGAGPRLVLGAVVLDTATPGRVVIDPGTFNVIEQGPLKAGFALQGHFVDPGGATVCDDYAPGVAPYQSMAFTAVMTMTRGTSHLDLQIHVRNECLDAMFGPFLDGARTIGQASWELPLATTGPVERYWGASAALQSAAGDIVVEQRKGAGAPWRRRARVIDDGATAWTAEVAPRPIVVIGSDAFAATAQMPWMRFREPQALAAAGSTLSLRFLSEPTVVGGGKGIWNLARVSFTAPVDTPAELETLRECNEAFLERGLLVRAQRDAVDAAAVFPSLGNDTPSLLENDYTAFMNRWHVDTVGTGGQHELARTFGSQLWPDTQGATWSNEDNAIGPTNNPGGLNYWNTSRAELLEFLRTGDPRWAWDLALPLTWQQLVSAYVNLGENGDGFKNGYALTSPVCDFDTDLCAEGQWYRYAGGSDDYTYTFGNVGYLLRPSYPILRRFAQAGASTVARYDIPRDMQELREATVNQVDFTRQVIQHFVQLANCAELVGGAEGQACHDRLIEVVTELSEENMASGLMCQGDIQPAVPARLRRAGVISPCMPEGGDPALDWCDCAMPQQFMMNGLMIPFLHRILLNYGDLGGNLQRGLSQSLWHIYRAGLAIPLGEAPAFPSDPQRPPIPINPPADWLGQPGWDQDLTPYAVQDVDITDNDPNTTDPSGDEGNLILEPNKPQTVARLLLADSLDPTLRLCGVSRAALADQFFLDAWDAYEFSGGWSKATAQVMQGMAFGVGLYDTCGGSTGGEDLVLDQDFESGDAGWTMTGLWHLATDSSCADPAYASPVTSLYYGQEASCDFDTGNPTAGDLVSPPVSGIDSLSTLTFAYRRQVEDEPGAMVDATEVAVRAAGTSAWTTVWARDSADASQNAWLASAPIPLAAWADQTIEIRFRFDSDDEQFNDFLGWMIDDVQVTGTEVPEADIFRDDFETGDTGAWSSAVP